MEVNSDLPRTDLPPGRLCLAPKPITFSVCVLPQLRWTRALQPIKGCSFLSQRVFLHLVTGRKGDGGSGGGCRACSHIILAFHQMALCPHVGLRHLSKTHCNATRNCAKLLSLLTSFQPECSF